MSAFKYILPVVAVANVAAAQNSCSAQGTFTVSSVGDASAVAACQTFTGNVALATDAASTISFDGVLEEISGDLIGQNASNVESISAGSLKRIGGDFKLAGMTQLSTVTFPQLTNIDGELNWQSIPNLGGLTFGNGVQRINKVTILDTQIQDLSGINLKSASAVTIGQNTRLNKLSWQLASVDGLLSLDTNGGGSGFQATFGNLATAQSIVANNVDSLTVNALKNVTGLFQINNANIETLYAPNLTSTGSFNLHDNGNLNNITVPVLKTINGGLNINNNQKLSGTISFDALTTIKGAVNATGSFDEIMFPQLNTIAGAVYVKSSGKLSQTCSQIQADYKKNYFQARPTCSSTSGSGGSGGSSSGSNSGTDSGSGSSTSSSAAAPGLISQYPVAIFGSTGLLAAMIGMI